MPLEQTETKAVLFVMVATVALSFKGVLAKLAYLADMGVDALLLLRFGIAAPLFWVGVYFLARKSAPLTWGQWKTCFGAGCAFFIATYTDFTAISLIGVSISRLILFTFPIWVMLINSVMTRTLPSPHQWFVFMTTYVGIGFVMLPDGLNSLEGFNWVGAAWAFACSISYAIYLISSQQIMKSLGSVRFTAASGTITLGFMLVFVPLNVGMENLDFPTEGIIWGAAIAVFCTVIPFFMLFEGIKRCGATQASLITLSGPVLTMIGAWLILGESLTSVQIAGATITVLGVASLNSAGLVKMLRSLFGKQKVLS